MATVAPYPVPANPEDRTATAQKVLDALNDARYDFRTIGGISKSAKLDKAQVENALLKLGSAVRQSAVTDKSGNVLYTLSSRPRKIRERLSEAVAFMAGSAR